jgi:hypothetical protein
MGTCESEFESASAREGATGDATDDVEDGWEGEGDEEGNDEREDAVEEEEEEEEDMSTEDICALFRLCVVLSTWPYARGAWCA